MTDILNDIHELAAKIGDGQTDQRHIGKLNSIMDAVLKTQVPKEIVRMSRLAILSKIEGKPLSSAKLLSHGNLEALVTRWGNDMDFRPNPVAMVEIVTLFQSVRLHEFERELALAHGQLEMGLK
jgi:hypothetical protein